MRTVRHIISVKIQLTSEHFNIKNMRILFLLLFAIPAISFSQTKKALDHTVYDGWQSIGERMISNDGRIIVYSITPQEGDGKLVIQRSSGEVLTEVNRGYGAKITEDDKFVIYKIKPYFKDTREAKIKKKKVDDMPKDSLGIFSIDDPRRNKMIARVRSFKLPEEAAGWAAFYMEKAESKKAKDSSASEKKADFSDIADYFFADDEPAATRDEGADLILKNLQTSEEKVFSNVNEYFFNKSGKKLLIEIASVKKDSTKGSVQIYDLASGNSKSILNTFNDAKGYAMDDEGTQVALFAERDSSTKAVQKFYKLWYYKDGMDTVQMIADRFTGGIRKGWSISDNSTIDFSKSGKRLMFGTSPVLPPKDTTVPEIDRVNVDVWNYKDDFLQTMQLKNRDTEEKRSYTAVYDWQNKSVVQLGNEWNNPVFITMEGDGDNFYSTSDSGTRTAMQWQGFTLKKVFHVDPTTGKSTEIKSQFKGNVYPSYTGKYLLLYDEKLKHYSVYNAANKSTTVISKLIPFPLYDEDNDVPDDPNPYGIAKWMEDDKAVLIYDRYDVWKVDPENKIAPVNLTLGAGRKTKTQYRVINTDPDQKFIEPNETLWLSLYNEAQKNDGIAKLPLTMKTGPQIILNEKVSIAGTMKSKYNDILLLSKSTFNSSPDLYTNGSFDTQAATNGMNVQNTSTFKKLTSLNPQQNEYLWGNAELFKWTAYTGKLTEGVVYKPENFDPTKKYPMIVYFYERGNNTLYNYIAPSPTPSRLNIPFFVSRGYVVFVPDIWYKTGYPGKSAYDYIVSGTRAVVKQGYVDSTKIGLQGQSWGGYQIAHLITRTNLYAAAWAGAPVANMTSAYGGIRWGSGMNRQFQYEKTQSRIGATLWEKPELYIENSPLFHLPKVKTPLVIMANDADDAVPWYQGIELFTGLRRLGKPVWLLNYNGEAHNLVERKNRKDIQIREQQFFDWMLKGEKPAQWLIGGVPAVMKGRNLGLEIPAEETKKF
jgi:dienelactone hydrolase